MTVQFILSKRGMLRFILKNKMVLKQTLKFLKNSKYIYRYILLLFFKKKGEVFGEIAFFTN